MKYLIATKNMKKRLELKRILAPLCIDALVEEDLNMVLEDVEETGTDFEENALLKARAACLQSGLPCVADDSGLEVDALNGAPGVYSARFAGEHGNDDLNNAKLLDLLGELPLEKRSARFVSAACCVYPNGEEIAVRGTCEGHIGFECRGSGGFGYDCVFLPSDIHDEIEKKRTMAQLSDEEKDSISHRGRALALLSQKIGERL